MDVQQNQALKYLEVQIFISENSNKHMSMDLLLDKVIRKIKPSAEEEKKLRRFIDEIVSVAESISGLECIIVGSTGKGTWLSGDHDIDLFMLFPVSATRKQLEETGLSFGLEITKHMKGNHVFKFAEHPYVSADFEKDNIKYNVDIVPCYNISGASKIKSAVDRSPLHLEYVRRRMKKGMPDDIRLLKQFCKGIDVYGSDARHQGFSGYICELLVLKYGSFENVLKNAVKWKAPQTIVLEKNPTKKFYNQPLVIIDPVDSNRNAAANVSCSNFFVFIESAKKFLKKPSLDYFFPKGQKITAKEIRKLLKRGTKFVAIRMSKPDVVDDIIYPQMRRAKKRLENMLLYNEFVPLRSYVFADAKTNEMIMLFELEIWNLPKIKRIYGPPIFAHDNMQNFIKKYSKLRNIYGPYIRNTRVVIEKEREFKSAVFMIQTFIKQSIEKLAADGMPTYIARSIKKAEIIEGSEFWDLIERYEKFSKFLRKKYFG